jgi:hypothetical protein
MVLEGYVMMTEAFVFMSFIFILILIIDFILLFSPDTSKIESIILTIVIIVGGFGLVTSLIGFILTYEK